MCVASAACSSASLGDAAEIGGLRPSPLRSSIPPEAALFAEPVEILRDGEAFLRGYDEEFDASARGVRVDDLAEKNEEFIPGVMRLDVEPAKPSARDAWARQPETFWGEHGSVLYPLVLLLPRSPRWVDSSELNHVSKTQDFDYWHRNLNSYLKSGAEVFLEPAGKTMLFVKSFYSVASQKTLLQTKLGFAIFENAYGDSAPPANFYIGPFALLNRFRLDQAEKLGAHLTLSEIGAFQFTLAAGYSRDRLKGAGAFGMMESSLRF